jgi:hypothetical protein
LALSGADAEAAQAIIAAWNGNSAIVAAVPGGIAKDRLYQPSARPYARLEVKFKERMPSTGSRYIDKREVKIQIWAIGDFNAGTIARLLVNQFDNGTLNFADSNVGFIWMEPLGVTVSEEEEVRQGDDYRACVGQWNVWTDRTVGF